MWAKYSTDNAFRFSLERSVVSVSLQGVVGCAFCRGQALELSCASLASEPGLVMHARYAALGVNASQNVSWAEPRLGLRPPGSARTKPNSDMGLVGFYSGAIESGGAAWKASEMARGRLRKSWLRGGAYELRV